MRPRRAITAWRISSLGEAARAGAAAPAPMQTAASSAAQRMSVSRIMCFVMAAFFLSSVAAGTRRVNRDRTFAATRLLIRFAPGAAEPAAGASLLRQGAAGGSEDPDPYGRRVHGRDDAQRAARRPRGRDAGGGAQGQGPAARAGRARPPPRHLRLARRVHRRRHRRPGGPQLRRRRQQDDRHRPPRPARERAAPGPGHPRALAHRVQLQGDQDDPAVPAAGDAERAS